MLRREVSKGTDLTPEFGDDEKIQIEFLRRAANFLEFIFLIFLLWPAYFFLYGCIF